MQAAERLNRSDEDTPHLLLRKYSFVFLVPQDFLVDVALTGIVHYNA